MQKTAKTLLFIGGSLIFIGGIIILVTKVSAVVKKYLSISAGEGGTTDPPPGRYLKNVGENVTIRALPSEGYTVGVWVVDGVQVAEQVESITVTMDVAHDVIVTFWKGGVPPPTPPQSIMSLGSVTVKSNIGAWFTGTPAVDQCCHVAHCDDFWKPNGLVKTPMKFKVVDAASRGVPNVDVALWTDSPPDPGRYRGTTLLDGEVHTSLNPLIKKTDADGVVSVDVSYAYGLNDKFQTICADAGVGFQWGCLALPCVRWDTAKDGGCLIATCYMCWTAGECETGLAGCEKMGGWQLNRVYANVVGTTLSTGEYAYCGFHVKWI